jgi:hypothetical protein
MDGGYSFRWGIPLLDDLGYIPIYLFMLDNYHMVLTRDEFLLVVHLAAYKYEKEGSKSYPSQDTVARKMGYAHRNSVNRLVRSMKDKGMLLVTENPGHTVEYDAKPFSELMWDLYTGKRGAQDVVQVLVGAQTRVQVVAQAEVQVGAQDVVQEEKKKKKEKKEEKKSQPAASSSGKLPANNSHPMWEPLWDLVVTLSGFDLSRDKQAAASVAKVVRGFILMEMYPEQVEDLWVALKEVTGADPRSLPVFHNYDAALRDLHRLQATPDHVRGLGKFWKKNGWPGGAPTLEGVRKHIGKVMEQPSSRRIDGPIDMDVMNYLKKKLGEPSNEGED